MSNYPIDSIRADFPILQTAVHGKPLTYLDNAATVQKPRQVLQSIVSYYETLNSNIHRGAHYLSATATSKYEQARATIASFLGAKTADEIIFVRGCTEAINLVANGYAKRYLHPGAAVISSVMEHHSNMIPWQQACKDAGAEFHAIRLLPDGTLDMEHFRALLKANVALVALTHVSNALGTINPVKEIIEMAHAVGAHVLLDGAQAVQHIPINVQELDCDFYVFSGHKLYAPTGIGCLYGKRELLEALPPYQFGGSMIKSVTIEQTVFGDIPNKFEAGTPNIEGALALATAIDYVRSVGIEHIAHHEEQLTTHIREGLQQRKGIRLVGTAAQSCGAVSFIAEGAHPSDIATLLDMQGIAVRAGHHCCEPLMKYFDIPGTVRASVGMYNTSDDVEVFLRGVDKALSML